MRDLYLKNIYKYHPPTDDQKARYEELRNAAKALAELIARLCPIAHETSTAFTRLEEAVMWANASIARNE
jgi:hypothetical protein